MSGNNGHIDCINCSAPISLRGKAMTVAVVCPSCKTYFRIGASKNEKVIFNDSEEPCIAIGSKGIIDDKKYEVFGFTVKKEQKYKYKWREYLLFNPFMGYAYLSEYDGHWNFIWPVEDDPVKGLNSGSFRYESREYKLFQKYNADVVCARGEFFFDEVEMTAATLNYEYISPPFVFGQEKSDDSVLSYSGEYLTPSEVASAFKITKDKLPPVKGTGYTQPILSGIDEDKLIILTAIFAVILLAMQFIFSTTSKEEVVYSASFEGSALDSQKVLVSPSFKLEGYERSLDFEVFAPVSNNWFAADFSLINEDNGKEYNFTKEIEYYSGYEDGESWSEGSQVGEAYLSRIPGGRYHVNIYPDWGGTKNPFSLKLKHDVPAWSNFFWSLLFLLLFPAGYFLLKGYYERQRWSESDYSPYHE